MDENGIRILIVDDERSIRRFLKAMLSSQYVIYEASTGAEALEAAAKYHPDLILLDLGLPDIEGVQVTRRIREWSKTPIIVISVREGEADKIDALDSGADDYLTKPFGAGELMARIRVALRHSISPTTDSVIDLDGLQIDFGKRAVSLAGKPVSLTPTEYEILRVLCLNVGKVLTHRQMLTKIWGASYETETHLLRVNISNLRRKIEPNPSRPHYIITEPGVGYRLRITDQ
jgi:two-component system, OmpR family, KDP operon response regulator KdpE